ncbi:serine/threonine protein kinase [Magnaporthiopsis poae ATCC 64411]|uniref:Serine/threonine protein kinase n=1 Tax=Magnaporthiopsis poae (strain ATCC 64411 / 73-15) TaxID=644358 RepID=A0A0C4EF87_MAGP6|nr:serine/threonine protein kinase [Magnaporthiopsis poae ATCC 64411]
MASRGLARSARSLGCLRPCLPGRALATPISRLHAPPTLRSTTRRPNAPLARQPVSTAATPAPYVGEYQQKPLANGTRLDSTSGKSYVIDDVLSERPIAGRLCCDGKQYVLKDAVPDGFEYNLALQKRVAQSAHVRALVDSIPDRHIFVFPHLETTLLDVQVGSLSPAAKKTILRDTLKGLVEMHDKNIFHSDIKPPNIMMDSYKNSDGTVGFRNIQITDLEDAVFLPPKAKGLADCLTGNHFWRSPESWARGMQHTPSDVFSFGIVVRPPPIHPLLLSPCHDASTPLSH